MSTHNDDLPPLPGGTSAFSLTGSIYTADDMRAYARAALAAAAPAPYVPIPIYPEFSGTHSTDPDYDHSEAYLRAAPAQPAVTPATHGDMLATQAQRFVISPSNGHMYPSENGGWVRYDDHAAALSVTAAQEKPHG